MVGQAYGGGQAEQALGTALKTLGAKREDVVIASKFGKHPALWETSVPPACHPTLPTHQPSFSVLGHRSDDPAPAVPYSGEMVSAALAQSLSLLQMDTIDLYQIHWPGNCGMYGDSAEAERSAVADVVGALEAAVAAGQIRFYGFCNFGEPPTHSSFGPSKQSLERRCLSRELSETR